MNRWQEQEIGAAYWQFRSLIDDALVSLAGRGVTARQIAADAGVSEATLSKWRHGDRPGDRARVERVVEVIDARLVEVGIDSTFGEDCTRIVDSMFPVLLAAVPEVSPPTPENPPEKHGDAIWPVRWTLGDLFWSIPLAYDVVFLLARFAAHRSGESRSPLDDGPSVPFALLIGLALAILGPLVANPARYRTYLERWASDRSFRDDIRFERTSPPVAARLATGVISVLVVLVILLPDFTAEIDLLDDPATLPSWAAPDARVFLALGLVVQVTVMMDLVLLSMWRMIFWIRTVVDLDGRGRFEVLAGLSDGGWWPPLRAAFVAIVGMSGVALGFRLLASTRSIPIHEQPTMVAVRVVTGVVLATALALLFVLQRAHEHRARDIPEAALLNLSALPGAIAVAVVLTVLFSG